MSTPFHTTRRVEFADTDMAGIVHFASFFRYMEAAEHAFLRSRGLSVMMTWEGMRITFPRRAAACDFKKPARFEDVLDVAVALARLGRTSLSYAIDFTLKGELCASGTLTMVCCRVLDSHVLEALEVPEGMRRRLEG